MCRITEKNKHGWKRPFMVMFRTWRIGLVAIILVAIIGSAAMVFAEGPKWIGAFFVKGRVGLKWQAVTGVTEYTIYRMSVGGEYEKLVSTEKTQYFDSEVSPGSVYSYKIVITGADGAEAESEVKKVTIPGSKVGEFKPPTWSGARFDKDKVLLRWDAVPGAIAYNVYRSVTSGEGYEIVGNATSFRYVDRDGLERGTIYFYVVTALNEEFEETEFSEEQSVKFGFSAEEIKAQEAAASNIHLVDTPLQLLFDVTKAGGKNMNQPADVFVNSKGDIYLTDALNFQVNCFDSEGKYKFSFGEMTPTDEVDNPPPTTFSYPFTLFIDKNDQVYVSDVKNHDIQVFAPDGKFIKRITVDVEEGMEEFRPNGIVVLDDGRIISTDAGNHRFIIIDQDGKILFSKGEKGSDPGQFVFPDEMIVTPDNTICVVDVINCRIQQFDMEGNFLREFGEAGQSAGTFGRPKALTVDATGRLWVSDAMANLVQVFTIEGEVKSAIGIFEDENLLFSTPRGIFIKDGRFYIVNRLPHRLMVFKIG
jgi:sugar lactone lactonase YvrE